MKLLSVNCTKNTLGVGLLLALASLQAQAQSAAPSPQPLAPPPTVGQPLNPHVPVAAPVPVQTAPAQFTPAFPAAAPMDESTLLNEVGKSQSRMTLLSIQAKMEQMEMDMKRNRLKFAVEQQEMAAKEQEAKAQQNTAKGLSADGTKTAKAADAVPEVKPSVRRVYSFDGNWFAEMIVGSSKVLARPGTVLIDGSRVQSINLSSVVVLKKGRRQVLPIEGNASISGVPSFSAPPVSSAPVAPTMQTGSLPPLPPSTR